MLMKREERKDEPREWMKNNEEKNGRKRQERKIKTMKKGETKVIVKKQKRKDQKVITVKHRKKRGLNII